MYVLATTDTQTGTNFFNSGETRTEKRNKLVKQTAKEKKHRDSGGARAPYVCMYTIPFFSFRPRREMG
jgi:hypothetical protein